MKIAISGKGGVGKTTIAAGLIKLFALKDYKVFAVDADPDVSLGITLGVPEEQLKAQPPLVEMKKLIKERTKSEASGGMFLLNPVVDDVLDDYAIIFENIKLLRMGAVKRAGTACYCPEGAFLNAIVNTLILGRRDVVILDFGAGIEHLTRGTSSCVDIMIIVTEPTKVSVETTQVIKRLASEMGVPKIKVVANKVRTQREKDFLLRRFSEDELLGCLEYNESLWERSMLDDVCDNDDLLKEFVAQIFDKITREVGDASKKIG